MTASLAVAAGMALGPLWGCVAVWASAVALACVEFLLARAFGQPLLHRLIAPGRLARAQAQLARTEVPLLLSLRLLPVASFNAMNLALGLSAVGWWRFAWTTALGIVPMTAVLTSSGAWLAP
jgi:uncharacterized membrane protein YdjX (TVP38/TMEM64 family)